VNPNFADGLTPDQASSLTRVEPPVRAVLVYVDRPQAAAAVDDCLAARSPLVWLHDALSPGAAVAPHIERLQAAGCAVIAGLCPLLFLSTTDPAHACLRWLLRLTGKEKRVRQQTR
jgi:predicted CoA-binding protein